MDRVFERRFCRYATAVITLVLWWFLCQVFDADEDDKLLVDDVVAAVTRAPMKSSSVSAAATILTQDHIRRRTGQDDARHYRQHRQSKNQPALPDE